MRYRSAFLVATVLLTAACQRELNDFPAISAVENTVEVNLRLNITPETHGTELYTPSTAYTRAIDDPDPVSGTYINDITVIQYNGTGDDAVVMGTAQYAMYDHGNSGTSIKLVATSSPSAILVIANAGVGIIQVAQGSTLGDFKANQAVRYQSGNAPSYIFQTASADASSDAFPTNATYLQRMSGISVVEAVTGGITIDCALVHNVARVDFVLKNSAGELSECPVTIKQVSLKNAPRVSPYFAAYNEASGDAIPAGYPFQNSQVSVIEDWLTLNWSDNIGSSPCGLVKDIDNYTRSFRFYVPANMRGSVINTSSMLKSQMAPGGATYLVVEATYLELGVNVPVTYTFYLGGNLIDNFDLRPNYAYTYNIEIKNKGDAGIDKRIVDWGAVDFRLPQYPRANCYIITPPTIDGYHRVYRIPVDRADLFWGGHGYENDMSKVISNAPWNAKVIWSDVQFGNQKTDSPVELVTMSGTNSSETIDISVKKGVQGNMVVGVYRPGHEEEILWSWHLWITDYDPSPALESSFVRTPGQYRYYVRNGEVHRYGGTVWQAGGVYENKVIMDRNLGSFSNSTLPAASSGTDQDRHGILHYQFGRKDPFPAQDALYGVTPGETGPTKWAELTGHWKLVNVGVSDDNNMVYSVMHPFTFIHQDPDNNKGYWTYNDKYNPTTYNSSIVWQDPNWDTAVNGKTKGKSLFDPCPAGWKVPVNGTWSDFTYNDYNVVTQGTETVNVPIDFPTTNIMHTGSVLRRFTGEYAFNKTGAQGLYYWPVDDPYTDPVTNPIYVPASGYRNSASGALTNMSSYGYCWSCSPNSSAFGRFLYFYSASLGPSSTNNRANGFAVRCVQE